MLSRLHRPLAHLTTSCRSYAKWTFIESSPSLTRASKLRKLNSENKELFGATVKEKKSKKTSEDVETQPKMPPEIILNDHDISSEMYWVLGPQAVVKSKSKSPPKPPPVDSSDPHNIAGLMRKMESQKSPQPSNFSDEISDIKLNKKVLSEKRKLNKLNQPQLPDTLNKLKSSLPSAHLSSSSLDSSDSDDEVHENKIPLSTEHLRAIPNFPIVITKTNRIVSTFDDVDQFYPTVPSVSKVLQATMPESARQALINWKNLKIAELGLEGFDKMQKGHLKAGKDLHSQLQAHFQGLTVDLTTTPDITATWHSIAPELTNFTVPATLIEARVRHPFLCYHGVVDCVSLHKSSLSVIEWKKSDRPKKSLNLTFDAPIQLVSYIGALNASREEFRKSPIKHGSVVVAYSDGQPADVFELSESEMKKYWKVWTSRLQEYWVRYRDNTLPKPI